ncbi:MAG TPA: CbiQ family ECF transporter T component [Gallionella sp.]
MRFHPATQILVWCLLAVAMQVLVPGTLLVASGSILTAALMLSRHKLVLLLRRTRWVMLSLLLIYAYSTPGHALLDGLGMLSPTHEGITDGMLQLMRLLASLAALAMLLERLHRDQLISGLYALFTPLRWLGVSRERLAVRLALTLHYAEVVVLRGTSDWQATLRGLFAAHDEPQKEMSLPLLRFGLSDAVLLLAATMTLGLILK